MNTPRKSIRISGGFTLLELVIVLAILAALTTVAVRSLDGVEDQSRYEATRHSLDNLQAAVLGADNERDADGSLLVTGFVADVGRLPYAVGNDPTRQLQELWSNPNNVQAFAIGAASDDPAVVLGTGWHGNYLRLSLSQSSLVDGWGQAYGLSTDGSGQIVTVSSSGAAGSGYGAGLLTVNLGGNAGQPASASYATTVSGCVYQLDSVSGQVENPDPNNGPIMVCYFGPNPNTGGILETLATVSSTTSAAVTIYSVPATIGPRVLRAYQLPAGMSATLGNLGLAALKSVPVRITLQTGGQVRDLVIH
jgi:prepilin-type N-terminal cleavage/methylation domain-containing protein